MFRKTSLKNIKAILATLALVAGTLVTQPLEVRYIVPPRLDTAHLGQRILCHRPMRHGSPCMAVERIGQKIVAHNYGHGGSGWTLGSGSADYVIGLLEKFQEGAAFAKDTPIAVIGAGILGLFSAYCLVQRGYTAVTIVAENFEDLTSHKAGGLLAPVSMDNDPEMQTIIYTIGIDAYKFYASIAQGIHPIFHGGAFIMSAYFRTEKDSGLEAYVGNVMQPAKHVLLDFGNGTTQTMVVYDDGIFIDTPRMMQALTDYLQDKVSFVQKKIENFDDVSDTCIINCTGLGSMQLNADAQLVSVQGHLILLKDQKPQERYMIVASLGEAINKHGQKVKRHFYLFPKRTLNASAQDIGVIGGTFIEGATADTPNEEEFDIVIQGAREFYGIKT